MFSQTFRSRLPTSQAWRLGFREDEGEHVSRTASHTGESKRLCSGRTERRAEAGQGAPNAGPTWEPVGPKKPVEGRAGSGARPTAGAARRPEPGRPPSPPPRPRGAGEAALGRARRLAGWDSRGAPPGCAPRRSARGSRLAGGPDAGPGGRAGVAPPAGALAPGTGAGTA